MCFANQVNGFDIMQVLTEGQLRKDCIEQYAIESFFILVVPQVLILVGGIFCMFFGTCEVFPRVAANKKKITENIIPITTTHRQTLSFDLCCTNFPKLIMLIIPLMHGGKKRPYKHATKSCRFV